LQEEKRVQDLVLNAIKQGLIASAHDVSEGGLAVALAECLFTDNNLGAQVFASSDNATALLFSESQSRFVVSVSPKNQAAFEELAHVKPFGSVTADGNLRVDVNGEASINLPVEKMFAAWDSAIKSLLK
jgi:phosphoribosylformylglycinamidine synthase